MWFKPVHFACLIFVMVPTVSIFLEPASAVAGDTDGEQHPIHQLPFRERRALAGIEKDIYSFWETVEFTNTYAVLVVPRMGAKADLDGKPFKHNASSRGYRHGDEGTELAFPLVGFLEGKKAPAETHVWIPCDRRTAFWEEGFYLVPLIVREETVKQGAVSFKKWHYDLLPGRFAFPRLTRESATKFRAALAEWKALASAKDSNTLEAKIDFMKRTLREPAFAGLHSSSLRTIRELGYFDYALTRRDEIAFLCSRMNSTDVGRAAREEIQNILGREMQEVAIRVAANILATYNKTNSAERPSGSSIEDGSPASTNN